VRIYIPSDATDLHRQFGHRHIHFLSEVPPSMSLDRFRGLVETQWQKSDWAKARITCDIADDISVRMRYMIKQGTDALIAQTTWS
jgi:hypothetical protein